jgi:hypothetical protein
MRTNNVVDDVMLFRIVSKWKLGNESGLWFSAYLTESFVAMEPDSGQNGSMA